MPDGATQWKICYDLVLTTLSWAEKCFSVSHILSLYF